MTLKLKRTPGLYLVGFMGSGKTTIGQRVADELGWTFSDIDAEIEAEQKQTIPEIFETRGEPAFREIEKAAIARRVRSIQTGRPMVVALGGGAFVDPATCELLEENGITIWLDCSLELVRQRIGDSAGRPLARDPERLETLYEERRGAYAKADFRIETNCDETQSVSAILSLPIF